MEGRIETNYFGKLQPTIQYETGVLDTASTSEMTMVLLVAEMNTISLGQ
jgi:hypothetical protein